MIAMSLGDPALLTSDDEAKAQSKAWAMYIRSIPDKQKPEWIRIVERHAPFFTALGTSLAIYVPKAFVHFKKRIAVAQIYARQQQSAAAQAAAAESRRANGAAQGSGPAADWASGPRDAPLGY